MIPVQHSPPAKNQRSQRKQAVLTPTERDPLDRTQSVHQLSANLDRGPPMEGEAPSRRGACLKGLEVVWGRGLRRMKWQLLLAGAPEASEAANLAHSNQPLVSQAEPNFLKMMGQMTQFIGQLTQEAAPRDNYKAPAFTAPSMKAPDSFDGAQAHKLREFIQYCQLNFHNDPANSFSDRKKVLYSTSFLTDRAGKLIEPYLSNFSNEDPSYLLNNWQLFETQLFTLFGDPNEIRKAEQELNNLRMKESGHASLYIADFRSFISRIGDWGERAYIHVYRQGLASRLLDQLASNPGAFETLQELMNVTLELDTRPHHKKNKKGKQFQSSKDKPHASVLNKDNQLIGYENKRRIKEGLCNYCGGKNPIGKFFKRPQNKAGSLRGFPSKQEEA
ncbi:hypothetical protein O181_010092 [Austropuccinia psidii MF-1]|uniref:Ty3 transposon capsid-like protein domain-containing protein n=1 Tax=Austropuccinia psidii MF-1 TaxID=1389203 RepID=A0A9Q3BRX8_9BASI|nr:hypothetical protein [Austropuccinia psidii MF-1]